MIVFILAVACTPETDQEPISEYQISTFQFDEFTIQQMHSGYRNKLFSVEEVVSAYLQQIELLDDQGTQHRKAPRFLEN